jgi:hypothetical protein
MFTPANFYGSSYYCSFNEAFDLVKTTKNIALDEISDFKVGPLWNDILSKWSKNCVKIVLGDIEQGFKVVGSGAFIKENKLIIAAHVLDFFHDEFVVITASGHTLEIPFSSGIINKEQDWAIFTINCPEKDLHFPDIAASNDHTNQYAMIHHGNESFKPLVAIGSSDSTPYFTYRPILDIDGGPSSSGAVLLNERGEIAMLHIGRKKSFATLRSQLSIDDIFQEIANKNALALADKYIMQALPFECPLDEELEHGYLDFNIELTENSVDFNSKVFEAAQDLIISIIKNHKLDFYTKAFGSSKTIFESESKDPKMKSLRVDVQKPAKDFANIHIQYKDESLAGILLSKDLDGFGDRLSDINGIVNFSLGKLINLLRATKDCQKVYMVRVKPTAKMAGKKI